MPTYKVEIQLRLGLTSTSYFLNNERETNMTVFAIIQVEVTDRELYDRYQANFMEVFNQFDGQLVVNDETPMVLEGEWDKTKVVVISFPDKAAFMAWATSPAYLKISKDRLAGSKATILLAQGL